MPHRGRHRWRRVDGGHERANLGGNSRQGDGKPRLEDATGYVAMAGQGNVRGPPALNTALGRCGASAQRSQFASAAMTVMFTDATTLQLARQPAQHGSSRPLATADDHESAPRQARFMPLASGHSVTYRGPHRRRRFTGAAPDLDRGNDEVKTCSHFTAVLPEQDTSRQS